MAWKQDLAKLKQQFGPEIPEPARKTVPKPPPKPSGPAALDDEDAVFLSAMGLKSALPNPTRSGVSGASAPAPVVPDPPVPETFQEAIRDLKGLKLLPKDLPDRASLPPSSAINPPRAAQASIPTQIPEIAPPELVAVTEPLAQPHGPLRFQLAAGMAIEVDGALDLRGHSLPDAMERLKDRLGDGVVLGWRSLQVTLGPDPVLHEGLHALLTAGQLPMVVRYAQAPVPMGGTQAWLLYFGPSPVQP
jgi:hypothetical protein